MKPENWKPKPPARRSDPIELHAIAAREFERLCSELFEKEKNIDTCDLYGTPGQTQFGIDLLAQESDAIHIQVGQCKCYKQFSVADIKAASEEFLNHWGPRWSKRSVRRFILFLACDVSATQKRDEILRQRGVFSALGLKYEVWSSSQIVRRLRPYKGHRHYIL